MYSLKSQDSFLFSFSYSHIVCHQVFVFFPFSFWILLCSLAGLELLIFLPELSKWWHHRCDPPHLANANQLLFILLQDIFQIWLSHMVFTIINTLRHHQLSHVFLFIISILYNTYFCLCFCYESILFITKSSLIRTV